MEVRKSKLKLALGAGCALAILASAANASAEERTFNVASARAADTIPEFARQAGIQIVAPADRLQGVKTPAIEGSYDTRQALAMLIAGTGLHVASDDGRTVMLSADPQSGSAAGDGADGTVAALVVTAQKKEENIQDVPIAISAFTEKALEEQKIEGGFDLLKAIPNVTFSKNNFTSYNFSIRGIGTKAVSVTTDPGVAVEFNSTPLIRNRLFEQEYFDVERVEVLRGPQGTLHGRNATAGVINVISSKPNMDEFKGWFRGEVGNYHTKRISAMVNVPLVQEKLAIRLAGALTNRAGYDYNSVTQHHINGRALWSGRVTASFNPTERVRADLIWERFNEDDDRSRTGKQLCHRDAGPSTLGPFPLSPLTSGVLSQGCKPGSLYDDDAFGTPNGLSIPFIQLYNGNEGTGAAWPVMRPVDPYGGLMQSRDLRTIASVRDPVYRARADVIELNFTVDIAPNLILTVTNTYNKDRIYSFQDYNRFNSLPVFYNTSDNADSPGIDWKCAPSYSGCVDISGLAPGGVFTDPQIGPSNTVAGFDVSKARSSQYSSEVRIESSFADGINFSAGANFTRYSTLEDYYVFYNLITATAESFLNESGNYTTCSGFKFAAGGVIPLNSPIDTPGCVYIDPNPIGSINGEGHNYFRSKNPYKLKSYAAYGEAYWQVSSITKITAGLRYTDDRKTFTPVPSQVLLSSEYTYGGYVDRGYPALPDVKQHWGEVTGRLGVDWQPDFSFTDKTMIYAFYSRGYKGGGANPPGIGFPRGPRVLAGFTVYPFVQHMPYPDLFRPEFVNAFELGAKNTLLGGGLVFNGDVFFYDYADYQVSQIKERTAVNENFNAKVWGLELEALFAPTRNIRLNASLGYMQTKIGNGEKSIDLMNRTQGNPDWVLLKPWIQLPSNCIAPKEVVVQAYALNALELSSLCPGYVFSAGYHEYGMFSPDPFLVPYWGVLQVDQREWPNFGQGFDADLGGNQLPNAPHWTINFGAQYSHDLFNGDWRASVRADAYWQSQSWARVYNLDPYDKLHGWYNVNLSVWLERPEDDLKIEFYAKNLLDKTPITDAFLNSDDTALTTNVFTLDPRLIGLSIKKGF